MAAPGAGAAADAERLARLNAFPAWRPTSGAEHYTPESGATMVSNAMAGLVQMFRETGEPDRRAQFSCSLDTWIFLRELGETFGWRPKGTTYVEPPGRKGPTPAARNYHPGEALDRKWVDAEDALAWASALDLARQSRRLDAMIDARRDQSTAGIDEPEREELSRVVDRFIEFSYGGAFEFAVAAY